MLKGTQREIEKKEREDATKRRERERDTNYAL